MNVKRRCKFAIFSAAVFLVMASCMSMVSKRSEEVRIQVYKDNPHYWKFRGKPVLLLGGSDEDNLFNNPDLMKKNLDTLVKIGGNYIRGTLSCRDEGNVWPFLKRDGMYNLNEFNPEFWNRLETCIREANARDIIVQIEIWATFDYYRENWLVNPFNPSNNMNYTTENTRLETEWNFHPARKPQPFFSSTPAVNNDTALLRYQEAFVTKVLDVTLSYPNVLYALDNETRAPAEWALYWGAFIKSEARKRGYEAQVTEMWDQWDISKSEHETTWQHPELFSFTDVSQNNWQEGQTHYDRLLWYRRNLAEHEGGVRPMNNVKVYSRRSGGLPNDVAISLDRWWQNIFAGCASTRFHRPTGGIGLDETAQATIRSARIFTSSFDIFACEPTPDLLSDREENEAYCLANPGKVYALYFPAGGRVCLEVTGAPITWQERWFDTVNVLFLDPKHVQVTPTAATKNTLSLESPDTDKTWFVLIEPE